MSTNWQEVTDLQQLRSTCQSFEAALRAEQGIQFEDGYEVNVADLQARIAELEEDKRQMLLANATLMVRVEQLERDKTEVKLANIELAMRETKSYTKAELLEIYNEGASIPWVREWLETLE